MKGFGEYHSPLGDISIYSEDSKIIEVCFDKREETILSTPEIMETIVQLDQYFNGTRKLFDLPLSPKGTSFQKDVWGQLQKIPFGKTTTYGELAIQLGDKLKVRAVGMANGKNPIAIIIPCHRVIGADGSLVGYASGVDRKEWLLRHEEADMYAQRELF